MVTVHPPLNLRLDGDEADRLATDGLLADDAAGLAAAYRRVGELWDQAVAAVRTMNADPAPQEQRWRIQTSGTPSTSTRHATPSTSR